MQDEMMSRLLKRVYRLEQEVASLQRTVGVQASPQIPPASPAPSGPTINLPRPEPARPREPRPPREPRVAAEREADVVGAWLGRAGAIAILIGAAFGFTYAVNRGLIGPGARVLIGLATGGLFLAWGEYALRKQWRFFSQAVSGGGLALLYLSILASSELFDLIPSGMAFMGLALVAIGGGAIAIRQDSAALAVLATFGGFLNPVLATMDRDADPTGLFLYVLALDAIVVATVVKRWRGLDVAAGLGTLLAFGVLQDDATTAQALAWASILAALFVSLPLLRSVPTRGQDLGVPLAAAAVYAAYMSGTLNEQAESWTGGFFAILVAVFAGLAIVASTVRRDELLTRAMTGAAVTAAVLFVPAQVEGPSIPTAWAVQGALLAWLGLRASSNELRTGGLIALALAVPATIGSFFDYDADALFVSGDGIESIIRIGAFATAAAYLSRTEDSRYRDLGVLLGMATLIAGLGWLSAEVVGAIDRSTLEESVKEQAGAFSISALWAAFSVTMLAVGIRLRQRRLRLFAATVLGIVVLKLAVYDIWLLRTSYRIGAFIGVGALLLVSSLMYQRLRDLVTQGDDVVNAVTE